MESRLKLLQGVSTRAETVSTSEDEWKFADVWTDEVGFKPEIAWPFADAWPFAVEIPLLGAATEAGALEASRFGEFGPGEFGPGEFDSREFGSPGEIDSAGERGSSGEILDDDADPEWITDVIPAPPKKSLDRFLWGSNMENVLTRP